MDCFITILNNEIKKDVHARCVKINREEGRKVDQMLSIGKEDVHFRWYDITSYQGI